VVFENICNKSTAIIYILGILAVASYKTESGDK